MPPDPFLVRQTIESCLGKAVLVYADNKHRGGSNGQKGTRYEDFFITVKIAEAASKNATSQSADDPHVTGQIFGLVDDAKIARSHETAYYQLKNKQQVSWDGGDHPIALDFECQHKISVELNETNPKTVLVVPLVTQKERLEPEIPEQIRLHSRVEHFPWFPTTNRLILECADIREILQDLAQTETPTAEELQAILDSLMIAFIGSGDDGVRVSEVIDRIPLYTSLSSCNMKVLAEEPGLLG